MSADAALGHVVEPQKQVPVAYDLDVAIVGAGIAGLIAALAAGRQGARTILIDRFGSLGGNLGPAMIVGGSVAGEAPVTLPGGLAGISKEMVDRMEQLRTESGHRYADTSNIISYLGAQMAEESGVDVLLPVWAADPIIASGRVTGLFVEGKSGRVAVNAKVVVDATADADVARRAGVPVITDLPPDPSWAPLIRSQFLRPEFAPWNDTAIYYVMGGVDVAKYEAFCASEVTLSEADQAWIAQRRQFPIQTQQFPDPLVPLVRQAWERGEFFHQKTVDRHVHITTPHIYNRIITSKQK